MTFMSPTTHHQHKHSVPVRCCLSRCAPTIVHGGTNHTPHHYQTATGCILSADKSTRRSISTSSSPECVLNCVNQSEKQRKTDEWGARASSTYTLLVQVCFFKWENIRNIAGTGFSFYVLIVLFSLCCSHSPCTVVFVGCAVFILASSTAHFIYFINIVTARWLIPLFLHRVRLYVGMCVSVCLSTLMSEASIETTLLSFHRCISKRWLFENLALFNTLLHTMPSWLCSGIYRTSSFQHRSTALHLYAKRPG